MKPFDYHAHSLNKAGLEQMIENMRADLITVIDGTDCNKEDWNITIKTDAINIKTNVEGDDWELNLPYEDGKVAHVRGMKLEGRDCLVFWMARHGNAHKALKALKSIMADFFAPDSKSAGFRIRVSNNALLTGWMVQEKEDHYSLIQLPTWTAPGEEIKGRTPYDLKELHENEDELFINNIWFAMFKDNDGYTVRYDPREQTFYVIRKFDEPVELDYDDLDCLELGPYEEVNYQGPAMTELGLLPPGQTPPTMVYSENGRQVAKIKEVFDGVNYVTYVLSHAQQGVTDQITFGREAVYGEQLLAVLTDRYTTLNEEVPHEANVKTLELLEEIKRLQAERYKKREEDGILGSKEVDSTEGKKVIVDVATDPADLPRDAEGNVADITPVE
jgi:hypothetical protein